MTEKLLDILIPAYGNPLGVKKILATVSNNELVNVTVSDDSFKENDIQCIKDLCAYYKVTYLSGNRSGAVSNWNSLLSRATCQYSVLVHHDEYFSNTNFIYKLLELEDIKFMVLPVVVKHPNNISRFVCSWQQRLLIRWFKGFGPMLNILGGPTALLIFKTSELVHFNPNLVYQVDCEWYAKMLNNVSHKNINFYRGSRVVSTVMPGSITDTIKDNLHAVIRSDVEVLKRTSWSDTMTKYSIYGNLILFAYRLVLIPSFIPFYIKRYFVNKKLKRSE